MDRSLLSAIEALYDRFDVEEPRDAHIVRLHLDANTWTDFEEFWRWLEAEHAQRDVRVVPSAGSAFLTVDFKLYGEDWALRGSCYSPRYSRPQEGEIPPMPDRFKELVPGAK